MPVSRIDDAKNTSEKITVLSKRAQEGDVTVQMTLAGIYDDGIEVDRDYGLAARWFHEAALRGPARAHTRLGELYLNGYGVDKNIERPIYWFRAEKLLKKVARKLTKLQLADATRAAEELLPAMPVIVNQEL